MDVEEQFWSRVKVGALGECWYWTLSTRGAGYGQCSRPHHPSRIAARAAFVFWYAVEPGDLRVCHSCDNTLCCNPTHLFLGTSAENTRDCIEKGRFKLPPRHKDTVAARKRLLEKYEDNEFRKEQGRKIREGWVARKLREQTVVRKFAFGG